jgi:hypothetical protein
MYKLIEFTTLSGQQFNSVKRLSDGAYIPFDETNKDYRKYLEWIAEGNEPLPADEE